MANINDKANHIIAMMDFKSNLKEITEAIQAFAKLYKITYDALIKQGFTSEQALYIIVQKGWNLGDSNGGNSNV